jgi:type IV secretory pathway VirB10-like protein
LLLVACGDPPPPPRKTVAVPKGDSALDDLIKRTRAVAPAVPAHLEADPGDLAFPILEPGQSQTRTVRLRNSGGRGADLADIHVAGNAAVFRLGGDCAVPRSLAAGEACQMTVTFGPKEQGEARAEVVVQGTAEVLFLPLSGAAWPPARPAAVPPAQPPTVQATASLSFARVRQDGGLTVQGSDAAADGTIAATNAGGSPREADYAEAGLKGVVSSFPVDRTRVITADRYIPAVLESTLSSQLPGRAVAVVERNVYGSEGRTVLIPAGSRAIGSYRSLGRYGDARLDITWSRILRPDGVTINIDDHGVDVMGRSGLPGDQDNRFFEKYGGSLLTSAIAAAGDWALGGDSTAIASPLGGTTQTMDGRARAANRLGNDLDRLGQRMVQETIDIRPVLTVPQGTRFAIVPSQDIWLRDGNRLQAVTPPKDGSATAGRDPLMQMAPGLVELIGQNPALQRVAPQTAQQILQSTLLQQLRDGEIEAKAPGGAGVPGNAGSAAQAAGPASAATPAGRP